MVKKAQEIFKKNVGNTENEKNSQEYYTENITYLKLVEACADFDNELYKEHQDEPIEQLEPEVKYPPVVRPAQHQSVVSRCLSGNRYFDTVFSHEKLWSFW